MPGRGVAKTETVAITSKIFLRNSSSGETLTLIVTLELFGTFNNGLKAFLTPSTTFSKGSETSLYHFSCVEV